MSALLTLSGVSKTFKTGTQALDRISLAVETGEFLSLLGPSGCGKSTVLRLIAGLLEPDDGTVLFQGGRPEIGFVFQEPTLMPWASTLDNARLPLDLQGVSQSRSDEIARRALARVGLAGFERAYPRELSGGMKMRVSVARAIVAGPKLLLMDEPFAALDDLTRQALNDDLLRLWKEDGLTVVFVTHSIYESAYLSSRVAVLTPRPGRISDDLRTGSPKNRDAGYRLTAEFTGTVGRISASLHGTQLHETQWKTASEPR